jgi:hypothetical protein
MACPASGWCDPARFDAILSSPATGRTGSAMADGAALAVAALAHLGVSSHISRQGPKRGAYTTDCSRLRHGAFAEGKHSTVQGGASSGPAA